MNTYRPAMGDQEIFAETVKEEVKKEIAGELWARQNYFFTPGVYRKQGFLLDERNSPPDITYYPDWGTTPEWENTQGGSQRKNILYGIGTVALLGILIPSFGRKVQTVLTRTASEGVELIEKARSIAARAKEDIEDLIAEADLKNLMKKPRQ